MAAVILLGSEKLSNDQNFQKLTSPKGSSLIIGTSRAARLKGHQINEGIGIVSHEIDSFLNYAFNLSVSPYGPSYTSSILRICNDVPVEGTRRFLLAIDPWALSSNMEERMLTEEDSYINFKRGSHFPKVRYTLDYNSKPNIELLMENGLDKHQRIINMSKTDTSFINRHTRAKLKYYRENHFESMAVSEKRIEALANLILALKSMGSVYLVRIPVSKQMMELEQLYAPDFMRHLLKNKVISETALLDFYPFHEEYECFDGNHMFEEDANRLSKEIGEIMRWHEHSNASPSPLLVRQYRNSLID